VVAGNSNQQGQSVASKVVALLDAFLPAERELSLNDLAGRAGLPLSTTYRLAGQLVDWGGLERAHGGGYRVGLRLWEIGSLASGSRVMIEVVVPYMQDLYEAVHENVQLGIRSGAEVVYLEKITGTASTPIRTRRGGRLPLHATGAGKVLLAFSPPEAVEELLRSGLRRYTPRTLTTPAQLGRSLAEIRRTGLGFGLEEMTPGIVSVAAPVRDAGGDVVAAISVVSRSSAIALRRMAPAVRTVATSASRALRERSVRPSAEGLVRALDDAQSDA
jgi:DNA-binding IclR family transcriptional regulator